MQGRRHAERVRGAVGRHRTFDQRVVVKTVGDAVQLRQGRGFAPVALDVGGIEVRGGLLQGAAGVRTVQVGPPGRAVVGQRGRDVVLNIEHSMHGGNLRGDLVQREALVQRNV